MSLKMRSRLLVFIFSFLIWIALTDISIQEMAAGLIVAVLVSWFAGHLMLATDRKISVKRIIMMVVYFFKLLLEIIKANFHVMWLVIQPNLPIKPAVVKIKSKLKNETALTILSNSITLTPGTLTLDVAPKKQELYIHWIDASSTDVKKATEEIGARFEGLLMEVFE